MSNSAGATRNPAGFVLCVESGEYDGELIVGKVYRLVRAGKNDPASDVRVVDESGEDYLYPAEWFVTIDVPAKGRRILARR